MRSNQDALARKGGHQWQTRVNQPVPHEVDAKYHVVFAPKSRRKGIHSQYRESGRFSATPAGKGVVTRGAPDA